MSLLFFLVVSPCVTVSVASRNIRAGRSIICILSIDISVFSPPPLILLGSLVRGELELETQLSFIYAIVFFIVPVEGKMYLWQFWKRGTWESLELSSTACASEYGFLLAGFGRWNLFSNWAVQVFYLSLTMCVRVRAWACERVRMCLLVWITKGWEVRQHWWSLRSPSGSTPAGVDALFPRSRIK